MKYKICPICGSHLDFGETCDCTDEDATETARERSGKGGEVYGEHIERAGGGLFGRKYHPARMGQR